jgi:Zn-dependent protease
MELEFLQWKVIVPFVKAESKRNYPPFRSPFLFISTNKLNAAARPFGKFLGFFFKLVPFFRKKIFNIEVRYIVTAIFFSLIGLMMIFNAKAGHDMGIPSVQLAIPGITLPFKAIVGLIVCVIVHEFGHAGVMLENGFNPKKIGFMFLGPLPLGAAVMQEEDFDKTCPSDIRVKVYAAGIFMNGIFTIISIPLYLFAYFVLVSNFWTEIALWILVFNSGVALINSLAIPPLDGYQMLKAMLETSPIQGKAKRVVLGSSIALSVFLLALNFGLISLFF